MTWQQFFKKKITYACHIIENKDSMYSWLFRRVTRGILTLQEGIYDFFFIGGITKFANIAGGKSLLTLICIV
jgi:hypothetical protein